MGEEKIWFVLKQGILWQSVLVFGIFIYLFLCNQAIVTSAC